MENLFKERLLELRKDKGLSQSAVANAIGVSQKAIDFWEKGTNEPKLSYIIALAYYFQVSVEFLIGIKDE